MSNCQVAKYFEGAELGRFRKPSEKPSPSGKIFLGLVPSKYNLADHQRGTCTLRGLRRRLVLKVEGLARVSKHAEEKTTSSDHGV